MQAGRARRKMDFFSEIESEFLLILLARAINIQSQNVIAGILLRLDKTGR